MTEKTDDDHQIDDAMVERARVGQSEAQLETKRRATAAAQSRRLEKTLDNCHQCLDNTAKHLIIAVANKVPPPVLINMLKKMQE